MRLSNSPQSPKTISHTISIAMEEMLGTEMRPLMSVKKFLDDYSETLKDCPKDVKSNFCGFLADAADRERRLESARQRCSLDHLKTKYDAQVHDFQPGVTSESLRFQPLNFVHPKNVEMKSFKKLLEFKERRNPFAKTPDVYKMMKVPPPAASPPPTDESPNEVVITVRFYRPARATHIGRSIEKPYFAEELVCLGSNWLSELRDKISCDCNKYRFFDVSDQPDAPMRLKTTDPGYFFITDTFYNDKRNPNNPDYSETVRTWAKSVRGLKDQSFRVADMHTTRFRDLNISVGFPQLYQHHGNCEHVFVFSQVSVLTPNARNPAASAYPYLRSFCVFNTRTCNICGVQQFSYVVEKSDRQLHDPAYLCQECYHSYHYVDGKKVGDFKAYRMFDTVPEALNAKHQDAVKLLSSGDDDEIIEKT